MTKDQLASRLAAAAAAEPRLQKALGGEDEVRVEMQPEARRLLETFLREWDETMGFMLAYFRGAEYLKAGNFADAPTDSRAARELVGAQMRSLGRHGAVLPIAIPAVVWLSCVERLMGHSVEAVVRNQLPGLKKAYRSHERDRKGRSATPLPLSDFVRQQLQPTGERGGETWLGRIERYVGLTLEPDARTALGSMIEYRHAFIHGTVDPLEVLRHVDAVPVISWAYAVRLFGRMFLVALTTPRRAG